MMPEQNRSIRNERGDVCLDEVVGGLFWLAVVAGMAGAIVHGVSSPDQSTDPNEVDSYQTSTVACVMPAQPVPNAASMAVTRDNRADMIYACNYFGDMKLEPNKKLALGEVTEETFDNNVMDGQIDGSIGGFAILATGKIDGELHGKVHSETQRERLYLVKIQDTDGNYVFTTLDEADKVRLARCDEGTTDCAPSIEFVTPEEPLWFKEPGKSQHFPLDSVSRDTTSIWESADRFDDHEDGRHLDVRRNQIVKLITQADGTPLPPGQVAAELAQLIILTIPE